MTDSTDLPSDHILWQTFIHLKNHNHDLSEMKNVVEKYSTLETFRIDVIGRGRCDLVTRMIHYELNNIDMESDDIAKCALIKALIKTYFLDQITSEMFIAIYRSFQSYIQVPEDILYYLNPIKFNKHTPEAFSAIIVDPSLNYSGFVSACKVKNVNDNLIRQFIDRMTYSSYFVQYEGILGNK